MKAKKPWHLWVALASMVLTLVLAVMLLIGSAIWMGDNDRAMDHRDGKGGEHHMRGDNHHHHGKGGPDDRFDRDDRNGRGDKMDRDGRGSPNGKRPPGDTMNPNNQNRLEDQAQPEAINGEESVQ